MLKANEIVVTTPRLTQIEKMELETLRDIVLKNDNEVRSGVPTVFIKRFEYLLIKFIETTQAQLN